MSAPRVHVETRNLLADLDRGQDLDLLHLITCPKCLSGTRRALGALRDVCEGPMGNLRTFLGRFEALELEDELGGLSQQPSRMAEILPFPREMRELLADLFAERAVDQSVAPQLAALEALPAQFGLRFEREEDAQDPAFMKRLMRESVRMGTARRMAGDWLSAEASLRLAARLQAMRPPWEEGSEGTCRALGLLRWEQGRLVEAEALLRQAARDFAEDQLREEEAECKVLVGLLLLERRRPGPAARLLAGSLISLAPGARPWLTVRGELSLALASIELGREERAAAALERARRWSGRVVEEPQRVFLRGLEGRVCAWLGQRKEAEGLLSAARRRLLSERRLGDTALVSIDLSMLLRTAGRAEEIEGMALELAERFSGALGLPPVLLALDVLAEVPAGRKIIVREAATVGSAVRQVMRVLGQRVEAMPWG